MGTGQQYFAALSGNVQQTCFFPLTGRMLICLNADCVTFAPPPSGFFLYESHSAIILLTVCEPDLSQGDSRKHEIGFRAKAIWETE
jgi:hypothetical protein